MISVTKANKDYCDKMGKQAQLSFDGKFIPGVELSKMKKINEDSIQPEFEQEFKDLIMMVADVGWNANTREQAYSDMYELCRLAIKKKYGTGVGNTPKPTYYK